MRKVQREAGIFAVFAGVALICGCGKPGTGEEEKESLKIGISVYDQYDTFVSEMVSSFQDYAKEKEKEWGIPITLEIKSAKNSQIIQNDQMDDFIGDNFDIVCINLVDRTDASTIIEKAKSSDIPVIFFNRELVEEDLERWDELYYVGADAFESGQMQGEILVEECKKNFEVTDSGYLVEKLEDGIANWNRDQAANKMKQFLESYGEEIEVVFANNDDMALGAIDTLKDFGMSESDEDWPVVLGIDGTVVGLDAVKKGEMLGTVLNDFRGQAQGMLELAYSIKTEKPLPEEFELSDGKYIRLPYKIVTEDNLGEVQMELME